MGENIDPTWVCFRSAGRAAGRMVRGSARARPAPLRATRRLPARDPEARSSGSLGVATIGDAEPACRWPHFAADERHAIATAYVPTGWERITGPRAIEDAPLALARSLSEDAGRRKPEAERPRRDRRARSRRGAAGRCQRRARRSPRVRGRVRRRPGLVEPARRARRVPGHRRPRRCSRVASAGRCVVVSRRHCADRGDAAPAGRNRDRGGARAASTSARTGALAEWVAPGGHLGELTAQAIEHARDQAASAARLWPGEARVDLSGGRDSRLAAAAVIAAGTPAGSGHRTRLPGRPTSRGR